VDPILKNVSSIQTKRNRINYLFLIVFTILLGLFTRTKYFPEYLYTFFGDYLYALMFFFIIGFVFVRMNTLLVAVISIAICFIIEFSQLYQAPWIQSIRENTLGGLILGNDFYWRDLPSYVLGGLTGLFLEKLFNRNRPSGLNPKIR